MSRRYLYLFFVPFYFLFTGCFTKEVSINNTNFPQETYTQKSDTQIDLQNLLSKHYKEWRGVKYKWGGNTKKGIDCSAFVQKTFKERLNINIPRTTALQSKIGVEVPMQDLEMGDLVFFRTGKNSRHVGIYLEGGKFMHASTKKGVTISRLDNVYYTKHFWKIQRVIN